MCIYTGAAAVALEMAVCSIVVEFGIRYVCDFLCCGIWRVCKQVNYMHITPTLYVYRFATGIQYQYNVNNVRYILCTAS